MNNPSDDGETSASHDARQADDLDAQLKRAQIELAYADYQMKLLEIDQARRSLRVLSSIAANPVVVAAFLTANVALGTAIIGWINSKYQREIEVQKLHLERVKFDYSMLSDAIASGERDAAEVRQVINVLIKAGFLPDRYSPLGEELEPGPALPQGTGVKGN